jgi:hypothetical protein
MAIQSVKRSAVIADIALIAEIGKIKIFAADQRG